MNEPRDNDERYGGEGQRLWPPFDKKTYTEQEQSKRRQGYQTRQTWAAIVVAILAFVATSTEVYVARDTERRQLRAYVAAWPVTVGLFNPDQHMQILFSIINRGVTPAKAISSTYIFFISEPRFDRNYVIATSDIVSTQQAISLPSGLEPSALRLSSKQVLDESDFSKVKDGKFVLVISGFLAYEDIFNVERHTSFCFSVSWDEMMAYASLLGQKKELVGQAPFEICRTGNDSD